MTPSEVRSVRERLRVITEITGELITVFAGRFSEGDGAPGGAMTLSEPESARRRDERVGIIRAGGAAGCPEDVGKPSRGRDGDQAE